MNVSGRPSQVGGAIVKGVGWGVLGVGLTVAIAVAVLFQALFPAGVVGYVLGVPLGAIAIACGVLLVTGGKSLHRAGAGAERETHERAIAALATNEGGALTAALVARSLGMPLEQADAVLTGMAERDPDAIAVDVDDELGLVFRFRGMGPRTRVAAPPDRVRVERPRDQARPDVVDVELVADDAPQARRRS